MAATRITINIGTASATSYTWRFWEGQVRPQIRIQFVDTGTAVAADLSGHAGVPKLLMKRKQFGSYKFGSAAMYSGYDTTAVDNTIGDFIIELDTGDMDEWGEYQAWFDLQPTAGKYERAPSPAGTLTISVKDENAV